MSKTSTDLFEVKTNAIIGRYAVASKDLKPGEVIFAELPFAFGPKADCQTLCLSCFKYVDCNTCNMCSKCQWPICDEVCEKSPIHAENECPIFATSGSKYQQMEDVTRSCLQYECITPLRCLLAMERNPKRWEQEIKIMQHHNDKRKGLPIWNFNQTNIVDYLRIRCKLERFSIDLIHTICGILEVNAFESNTPCGTTIRCLYPKLAILSHNCVSNITHSIAASNMDASEIGDFKVTVRATVPLKSGEELFSSYTYSIWPTMTRRAFLKESKYFDCNCKRCADPTELGSHMSTLKCTKCDNGVIISTDSLDPSAIWKCTHCDFSTRGEAVQRIFHAIQSDIDNVDAQLLEDAPGGAIEARESLYRKYRSVLHPRNAFHTMLRITLAQLYGKVEGYGLDCLPDVLLERKIEMCEQVLENLGVIEPGYTRLRGMILYELHAPLMLLTRNLSSYGVIENKEVRGKLEEVIKILEEAVIILRLEPPTSVEGALGLMAEQSLKQLKENIDELVNAYN